ncbi:hypothetical protein Bhyg_05898 [Pseudolycoriella hygida]|uniref:Uncharacterized protein n=1 Tax=Pseudolycoriella hygida TaxID=35572 RepID=A0A9Q0S2E8_9DIPT|nr:hypothetical protein Bhyg_05898 [Pseudolycoriella hygida]
MTSPMCRFVVVILLSNIFLIGACSNLLVTAKLPNMSILHGDKWVDNLITWSIVAICVGSLHTIFIFTFCFCSHVPEGSAELRNQRVAACLVELVAAALILTGIIVPGIDQWPQQYIETNLAMYSGILFIVVNTLVAFLAGRAACRYTAAQPSVDLQLHQTNMHIEVVHIRTTNWIVELF